MHYVFTAVRFIVLTTLLLTMDTQIFINRALRMDKIKCLGFDMDATLAIYNFPKSEEMSFYLAVKRLIDIGYPKEIQSLKYRSGFVVRNAWYDKRLGNLLKTDEHCNILTAFHGFRKLDRKEIRVQYPNKHVALEEARIFVLNTVFNLSEGVLLASLVDYFDSHENVYEKLPSGTGYLKKDTQQIILYSTFFNDCRNAIDWIHVVGDFKKNICRDLSTYIAQDHRAVQMMKTLSQHGKKLFLLTNSPWSFTDTLMTHVMGRGWQELFDVVIVNGDKPKWFLQDYAFKVVDLATGMEKIGNHFGPFQKGAVYSRGCATAFIQQMGLAGKDILYVGDHIFGDVLKSKKAGGWRTLLIVPELNREMEIWSRQAEKFHELNDLNNSLNTPEAKEDVGAKKEILREIARITDDMEAEFGAMGSLLRCGWRQTYFASQVKKYADIYTFNVYNIVEYSPLHCFNSPIYLLPHEEKFLHSIACASRKAAEGVQASEEIGNQEEGRTQPSSAET